jgi:hypothetical protein
MWQNHFSRRGAQEDSRKLFWDVQLQNDSEIIAKAWGFNEPIGIPRCASGLQKKLRKKN